MATAPVVSAWKIHVDRGGWQAASMGLRKSDTAEHLTLYFSLYAWILEIQSLASEFMAYVTHQKLFNNRCYSYTSLGAWKVSFYQYFSCPPTGALFSVPDPVL